MDNLMRLLPDYYKASRVMRSLMAADLKELTAIEHSVDGSASEYHISTASELGVALFERDYGIVPPEGDNLESRRSRVLALMKSYRTLTTDRIKEIVEDHVRGHAAVTVNAASYTVTISFLDVKGVPAGTQIAEAKIRKLLPAHLAIEFEYNFNTWEDLADQTWGDLSGATWADVKNGTI